MEVPSASDKSVKFYKTSSNGLTSIYKTLTPQSGSGIVIDARIREIHQTSLPGVYLTCMTVQVRLQLASNSTLEILKYTMEAHGMCFKRIL
jgi:hypothetical protein